MDLPRVVPDVVTRAGGHHHGVHSDRLLRSAATAVAGSFVAVTALVLPFALTDTDVPTLLVVLGRWLPGLISLAVILAMLGRGHLSSLWKVKPATPRELIGAYALALAVMLPVLIAPALVGLASGGALQPGPTLVAALPVVAVGTVAFAVSTLGEEVLWRGHVQTALARYGFWPMSALVGVVWALWHLPLNLTYLAQDVLSGAQVTAVTIGVAVWAPLLAALVERRGTVWPAVFAHAVPLSSLQLLTPATAEQPTTFWVVTVTGWALMLAAAGLLHHRQRSAAAGHPLTTVRMT